MKTTTFTADQLDTMRKAYATIETVNPDMLPRFHALFAGCTDRGIAQLAAAGIKFVSVLAGNEQRRRAAKPARVFSGGRFENRGNLHPRP